MFFEENQLYFEENDKCKYCEYLQNCFIIQCIKDETIEIIDAIDTDKCEFFIMCSENFNSNYIAKVLSKKLKPNKFQSLLINIRNLLTWQIL